jgi:hypothetical protein
MFVDVEKPDRFPNACSVCGKVGIVMPSWPLGDACCPFCGSLIFCKSVQTETGPESSSLLPDNQINRQTETEPWSYSLLPNTQANRQEAEAIAAILAKAVEDVKNRRAAETTK